MKRKEFLNYSKILPCLALPSELTSAIDFYDNQQSIITGYYFAESGEHFRFFKIKNHDREKTLESKLILSKSDFYDVGLDPIFYFPFHTKGIHSDFFVVFSSENTLHYKMGIYKLEIDEKGNADQISQIVIFHNEELKGYGLRGYLLSALNRDGNSLFHFPLLFKNEDGFCVFAYNHTTKSWVVVSRLTSFQNHHHIDLNDPRTQFSGIIPNGSQKNDNLFFVSHENLGHKFFDIETRDFQFELKLELHPGQVFQNNWGEIWTYQQLSNSKKSAVFLKRIPLVENGNKIATWILLSEDQELIALRQTENTNNGTWHLEFSGRKKIHGKIYDSLECNAIFPETIFLVQKEESFCAVKYNDKHHYSPWETLPILAPSSFHDFLNHYSTQIQITDNSVPGKRDFLRHFSDNPKLFAEKQTHTFLCLISCAHGNTSLHYKGKISTKFTDDKLEYFQMDIFENETDGIYRKVTGPFPNLRPPQRYRRDFLYNGETYHCAQAISVIPNEEGDYVPTAGVCVQDGSALSCEDISGAQTQCLRPDEDHSHGWNPWWDWRSVGLLMGGIVLLTTFLATLYYRYQKEQGWLEATGNGLKVGFWPFYRCGQKFHQFFFPPSPVEEV